jgi:riboflavin synthase
MFTGIVETTAKILAITPAGLTIERPALFDDIKTGVSICVSGVCLSVVDFDDSSMSFDVVQETWDKTNLGGLLRGDYVNVERSLKANGRFEGHVVQGHVEGTAEIASVENTDTGATLILALPEHLATFVVPKGSICIDGVSLTVASVQGDSCTIALIPHTREVTTLGDLQAGDSVNIETDILGRYILSSLSKRV